MWGCCRWSALKGVLVDAVTGILGVGSGRGERAGGLGELAETFVKLLIARCGTVRGSGLGAQRWVVERAFAYAHWFRRLQSRCEVRDDIHEAFLRLGCALICWRRLMSSRRLS
jgi:hypothetical protein